MEDLIVSGGESVSPSEVERALLSLDGVLDAVVVGVPDDRWGEVGLAVVVADHHRWGAEGIRAAVQELIPAHKVPRYVRFVDALPRTASGAVEHARLPGVAS